MSFGLQKSVFLHNSVRSGRSFRNLHDLYFGGTTKDIWHIGISNLMNHIDQEF